VDPTHAALPLGPSGLADGNTAVLLPSRLVEPPPTWLALAQVFMVSGIPTGLLAFVLLVFGAGIPLGDDGSVSIELLSTLMFLDTAFIAILMRVFLEMSGESSRDVFVGLRPVGREILRGLALVPVVFIMVGLIVLGLRAVAPWLHNVKESPLEQYMQNPLDAGIFFLVAVLAGGVREELQRAFVLRRFGQRLGGLKLGLIVYSLAFALMHYDQGWDVAIAVGTLGLIWGFLYIRRGSAVMGMTNHAGFNGAQVLQAVIARSFGA
jgi:membrane protease YdiL (CAAX protease family)